jgi:ubiquinone/menaquinone biosynthesis C-methylase UbiE
MSAIMSFNPARERENRKYADERWTPMRPLRPSGFSRTRYDNVARLLRGEEGRVLDFGCGSGKLLAALSSQFVRLDGIDISDARIRLGTQGIAATLPTAAEKIHLRVSDGQDLPYDDSSFDAVVACVVLEVVPDLFHTMDEFVRVLKPGGCLVVTVANVCALRHVFALLGGNVPMTYSVNREMSRWREQGWDDGALRYFSKRQLTDLLHHVGLAPEEWTSSGKWASLRQLWSSLGGDLCVRARKPGSSSGVGMSGGSR